MSEFIINVNGVGRFSMSLDLVDPAVDDDTDVWRANFCDDDSGDCTLVFFEMGVDYEVWDLVDAAISAYRSVIE